MSSSAFCIDAAASTVTCLPCVDGGDVTTIAYSAPPAIAANMSVISSAGSCRSNCEGPLTFNYRKLIADFSARQLLPTLHGAREDVAAGALMSYGANLADLLRRAAGYVDKNSQGRQAR